MATRNPLPVRLVMALTCDDQLVAIAHDVRMQTA
jgi:hypothetical protein